MDQFFFLDLLDLLGSLFDIFVRDDVTFESNDAKFPFIGCTKWIKNDVISKLIQIHIRITHMKKKKTKKRQKKQRTNQINPDTQIYI